MKCIVNPGHRLKMLRIERGMSRPEFCRCLAKQGQGTISADYLAKIEYDKRPLEQVNPIYLEGFRQVLKLSPREWDQTFPEIQDICSRLIRSENDTAPAPRAQTPTTQAPAEQTQAPDTILRQTLVKALRQSPPIHVSGAALGLLLDRSAPLLDPHISELLSQLSLEVRIMPSHLDGRSV